MLQILINKNNYLPWGFGNSNFLKKLTDELHIQLLYRCGLTPENDPPLNKLIVDND